CFFFSSRRRHTRCYRDWSSDVCSSDLPRHERDHDHGRSRERSEHPAPRPDPHLERDFAARDGQVGLTSALRLSAVAGLLAPILLIGVPTIAWLLAIFSLRTSRRAPPPEGPAEAAREHSTERILVYALNSGAPIAFGI